MNNENKNSSSENNAIDASSDNKLWKKVSIGTFTGILLGAGVIYTSDQIKAASNDSNEDDSNEDATGDKVDATIYCDAPVSHVSNAMSFDEAFAAARAEVGPGGVFAWHGGIYGTYYEDEWDAMSEAQRTAYAQSVHPEIPPQHVQVNIIDETHPDVVVDVHISEAQEQQTVLQDNNEVVEEDNDVHIIGYGEVQGHAAVAIDVTGNEEADVMVIDVDDTGSVTDPDVVVYNNGMATTVGDLEAGNPPVPIIGEEHQVNMETPDVAPDMPDYIDDGSVYM